MRMLLVTAMLIVGLVAVAVPICRNGECAMVAGSMSHSMEPMLKAACTMASAATGVVEKALPPSSPSLLVGLFALFAFLALPIIPGPTLHRLRALANPPDPPRDPRGVCLLI
jgi:hypothetical protein